MNSIVKIILVLLLSPIAGCFIAGVDRKITARLQNRVGPPLLQPFYDFYKLLHKENSAVSRYQNIYVLIYFVFVVTSLLMLFFEMDLLAILFVFTIANIAIIIGGMSTGSPFSTIGSQRETMTMLAYEPVLIFYILGVYMLTGSFEISVLRDMQQPIIKYLPLIFIAMLFIMGVKFKKSPFDFSTSHHAHQELVKGIFTEFSGPSMALIEMTHWYETIFLLGLMYLFAGQSIIFGGIISIVTYLLEIVVDNISARLTWQWLFKFTWIFIVSISILNILFIHFQHIKLT